MKVDVKAPSVGESITEVRIANWKKQNGEAVKNGDVLVEIESDKATVEVIAESAGTLQISKPAGEMVKIGEVLATIDDSVKATVQSATAPEKTSTAQVAAASAPRESSGSSNDQPVSPAVRKMTSEMGVDPSKISGTGKDGRVTKGDVIQYSENKGAGSGASSAGTTAATAPAAPRAAASQAQGPRDPRDKRVPMSLLRQKIAERLVYAQHTAAILTTFNECDMTAVNAFRTQHKENFKAKHGTSLGFMSFFTRAVVEALKAVPSVNGMIDGKDMVYRDYCDIGVAVGTERGLVVPVLRGAEKMSFLDIEKGIMALALKARDGKLSIQELSGGTFTISNGGVYGSLLSTPILNPPQSGILGMHKIQDRPVALNGQIMIRPMMYLALSYDHRIIDGKEAVTFLIKVKEGIENPDQLGFSY